MALSFFSKLFRCIYVDNRTSKHPNNEQLNTTKLTQKISRRCLNFDGQRLPIFPEGTTTNGSFLIHFRTGAFAPGFPVQPVIIRFCHWHDTCSIFDTPLIISILLGKRRLVYHFPITSFDSSHILSIMWKSIIFQLSIPQMKKNKTLNSLPTESKTLWSVVQVWFQLNTRTKINWTITKEFEPESSIGAHPCWKESSSSHARQMRRLPNTKHLSKKKTIDFQQKKKNRNNEEAMKLIQKTLLYASIHYATICKRNSLLIFLWKFFVSLSMSHPHSALVIWRTKISCFSHFCT